MSFIMPPLMQNERGFMRRVGIELEFAGIEPDIASGIVQSVFGGEIRKENEFTSYVAQTEFGEFTITLDAVLFKEKRYETYLAKAGIALPPESSHALAQHLLKAASFLVPYEVITPPIPLDRLEMVEELRAELHSHGARGTRSAIRYAFGLHFNPEIPALDLPLILSYLQAFLVLYPWLHRRSNVDFARKLTPYIDEFPEHYARQVLKEDYDPSHLIRDYLLYNATRNRPLDLLPLLTQIDSATVMAADVEKDLIKPRPALHYRLPNCLIDEPDWSIAGEWNNWTEVEKLAAEPSRLRRMCGDYLALAPHMFPEALADEIEKWLGKDLGR
jgi:hypothetical protein